MWNTRVLSLVTHYQLVAVALSVVLALWLWPTGVWGVALGGLFAVANFWGLRTLVGRTFTASTRHKLAYGLLLTVKTMIALAIMAVLLLVVHLHPLAFALGLATMFVGIGLAMTHVLLTASRAPLA
jgi:hypothetical protein